MLVNLLILFLILINKTKKLKLKLKLKRKGISAPQLEAPPLRLHSKTKGGAAEPAVSL